LIYHRRRAAEQREPNLNGAFSLPSGAQGHAEPVPRLAAGLDSPNHPERFMTITWLTQKASFGPDEIRVLIVAFEDALSRLRLNRNEPRSEALAKRIIYLARCGERDPVVLRQHAVRSVSEIQ
jgi:hypothetical protein